MIRISIELSTKCVKFVALGSRVLVLELGSNDYIVKCINSLKILSSASGHLANKLSEKGCFFQNCDLSSPWVNGSGVRVEL